LFQTLDILVLKVEQPGYRELRALTTLDWVEYVDGLSMREVSIHPAQPDVLPTKLAPVQLLAVAKLPFGIRQGIYLLTCVLEGTQLSFLNPGAVQVKRLALARVERI
jgi:hypothetical protein